MWLVSNGAHFTLKNSSSHNITYSPGFIHNFTNSDDKSGFGKKNYSVLSCM